jgi:pyrimidine operon attenuation protein/uracil phosphoribosyltransferase
MALEIVERTGGSKDTALVGILHGGFPIAQRLATVMTEAQGHPVSVGAIDMTLYRDDAASSLPTFKLGANAIDFPVAGRDVVLVDDVLHTGRTVRAAISSLFDYGRPRRIWLAVLCDRGGRELPIAADFVGRVIDVKAGYVLDVRLDGDARAGADDRVLLLKQDGG